MARMPDSSKMAQIRFVSMMVGMGVEFDDRNVVRLMVDPAECVRGDLWKARCTDGSVTSY
jgi:hypothetical protein